jgi:capsular polysaccharide biosynthesis protein
MINFIKKIYIALFTKNPYKVISFNNLIRTPIGEPVGVRETLNNVLIEEKGEIIFYPPLPKSYNGVLTEEKVNQYTKYNTGTIYKEEDRFLYSIESGHIIGFLGLVYDKEKRTFIDEAAKLWTENLKTSNYTNFYSPPQAEYLQGVTLSCSTTGADGGFYHFFHEVLPKLFFCREVIPYANNIIMNGPAVEWKEKWLRHIGIDLSKVIWIDNNSHYKCRQLLFTNRLIGDYHMSKWSINAIKSLLNITTPFLPSNKHEVIWITRKNVFDRIIAWEDELLNQFPAIKKIDVRDLSVTETILVFENATHVISPHGAGLSNIMMCRPKTKVLELFPDIKNYQPCYFRISSLCGLEHFVAETDFNTKKGMDDCSNFLKDFLVPLKA